MMNRRRRRFVLFHPKQLWALLHFALISCRECDAGDCNPWLHKFGRAALMVNDLLESIPQKGMKLRDWKMYNSSSWIGADNRSYMEEVGRSYYLWREAIAIPGIKRAFATRGLEPPDEQFGNQYQLPFSTFMDHSWATFGDFVGANTQGVAGLLDPRDVRNADQDVLSKVLSLMSRSPARLGNDLITTPNQGWTRDFSLLQERPLLEVEPQKFVCPDLALLADFLNEGVFWLLAKSYGSKHEKSFREMFGEIFQRYVNYLLEQYLLIGQSQYYFPAPKFEGKNDEVADALVCWHSASVLFEFKAFSLSRRAKYGGVPSEFREAIIASLASPKAKGKGNKGVAQLASSIARIQNGERINCRPPLRGDAPIVPVLVVNDRCVEAFYLRDLLQEQFDKVLKDRGGSKLGVRPLVVLSIRELELIDRYLSADSIEGLLLGYSSNAYSEVLRGPFLRFLHFYPNERTRKDTVSARLAKKAYEASLHAGDSQ